MEFPHGHSVIGNMFENMTAVNEIEGLTGKRKFHHIRTQIDSGALQICRQIPDSERSPKSNLETGLRRHVKHSDAWTVKHRRLTLKVQPDEPMPFQRRTPNAFRVSPPRLAEWRKSPRTSAANDTERTVTAVTVQKSFQKTSHSSQSA